MTNNRRKVSTFWRFFEEHSVELAAISSADEPVYDLILEQLQQIDPGLYYEFSSDSVMGELIITADGDISLFPLVEEIVTDAPVISGWSIIALKPKLGFPVTAKWDGITVTIANVVFDPLEWEDSQDLGLRIFVPDLIPEHVEDAHNAILRALDHALGEKEFAESVQYTEVVPLPNDALTEEYIPLTELENFINWRKNKQQ